MINDNEFVEESLIINLYYLRTLREYCARIQVSFPMIYQEYIKKSDELAKRCEELGASLLEISNYRIPENALLSGIFLTRFTLDCELLTEKLFGIDINTNLSILEENLKPGSIEANQETVNKIKEINEKIIILANNFIEFITDLYEKIKNQEIFAFYYNSINNYMREEIKLYITNLERLNQKLTTDPSFVTDFEYYKNAFLYGVSTFVRGEIDPANTNTWNKANDFAIEYRNLILEYKNTVMTPENQKNMTANSLELARRFKLFLEECIEKLLKKELYFISAPITKDNALTAVNYFIYNLEKLTNKQNS